MKRLKNLLLLFALLLCAVAPPAEEIPGLQCADPVTATIFIIGLLASLAGTAYSSYQKRQAAKQTEYNAEHQANVEKMKAEEEAALAQQQRRQDRKKARMRRASIEARFAKSGLLMSGTPAYVLEEQAKVDELNILEGKRVQDVSFMRSMERAALVRQQGEFEADALRTGANTTLISGLGSAAMSGAKFKANGGFGENSLFSKTSTETT